MMPASPDRNRTPALPWTDVALIAFLVALAVVARVAPHAPNFTPVAATALFAAGMLRVRAMAFVVPLLAMALSDAVLGFYDWRVTAVVYGSIALPALAGCLFRGARAPHIVVPIMLSSSLTFFATTNLAVWAFSGIYAPDVNGLIKCYVAALPFLQNTVAGDLFWTAVLFGGYWLLQAVAARRTAAVAVTA